MSLALVIVFSQQVRVGEVGGNSLGFYGGVFAPDGKSIVSHGYHGALQMWTNKQVTRITLLLSSAVGAAQYSNHFNAWFIKQCLMIFNSSAGNEQLGGTSDMWRPF